MVEQGDYKKQYVRVEANKSSQINTSTVIFKSTSNEYFTIEVTCNGYEYKYDRQWYISHYKLPDKQTFE